MQTPTILKYLGKIHSIASQNCQNAAQYLTLTAYQDLKIEISCEIRTNISSIWFHGTEHQRVQAFERAAETTADYASSL